jgi:RNA polymerase sigma factor (sigma-70 family)
VEVTPGELVLRARDGDERAWNALVERLTGLAWAVARAHGLGRDDAAEVNQVVWLRLVEHLDRLHEPDRVGAWVASVARNESRRVLRRSGREVVITFDADQIDLRSEPVDQSLLRRERDGELWEAFARLPVRCRTLLRVLMAQPRPGYAEVAAALDMPVGSIGPTRMRCVAQLRQLVGGRITERA